MNPLSTTWTCVTFNSAGQEPADLCKAGQLLRKVEIKGKDMEQLPCLELHPWVLRSLQQSCTLIPTTSTEEGVRQRGVKFPKWEFGKFIWKIFVLKGGKCCHFCCESKLYLKKKKNCFLKKRKTGHSSFFFWQCSVVLTCSWRLDSLLVDSEIN